MSPEKELQGQKNEQETEQQLSLAELSRQYLKGKISLEDYLIQERQFVPKFGEVSPATKRILKEFKHRK